MEGKGKEILHLPTAGNLKSILGSSKDLTWTSTMRGSSPSLCLKLNVHPPQFWACISRHLLS